MESILVLGAGVSGLTTAIRLAEQGHSVRILAREISPNTTSDVAAAIWAPYRCEPVGLVNRWAAESFVEFEALAADASSGVVMRFGVRGFPTPEPSSWVQAIGGQRLIDESMLPAGCLSAVQVRLPMIKMDRYMPWLGDRAAAVGVSIEPKDIHSLDEVSRLADVIVNATGLGARQLVGDDDFYGVRGRVVLVEQIGLTDFVDLDTPGWPVGIFPRQHDIVLTGTYEPHEYQLEVPDGLDDEFVGSVPEAGYDPHVTRYGWTAISPQTEHR
jgi:D-amino-acid oxidase